MTPLTAETARDRVVRAADVRAECVRLGFDLVGLTRVGPSEHGTFLRGWLDAGRHGEMSYLAREDAVQRRLHPEIVHDGLRSAIVLGINYFNEAEPQPDDPSRGNVARYARGRDYHKVIKRKLITLLRRLEEQAGTRLPLTRACVDTAPVLERELAQRAGLGWFGRSTMLINPGHGSYFFLAALLTELELDEYDTPFERDHCGSCNACVDACPTGALLGRDAAGAPVIDATRCISYLTIENRGPIPHELRPLIGNRVFGCDICQEVCPWNAPKFVQLTREPDFAARDHVVNRRLVELMAMGRSEWDEFSRGSAIRRAGYVGFRRNVAVALGNWGSPEAAPVLIAALHDPEPLVRGHSAWALSRTRCDTALAALRDVLTHESDTWARAESVRALELLTRQTVS